MSEPPRSPWNELACQLKPVFLLWEKLRVVYNAVLVSATVLLLDEPLRQLSDPWLLFACLAGAVLANLCFFLGPVAESYLRWLGSRSGWTTAVIFIVGTFISLPLVAYAAILMNVGQD